MPKCHLGDDLKHVDIRENCLFRDLNFCQQDAEEISATGEPVPKSDAPAPLEPGDHPELNVSPLRDANQTRTFMFMISAIQ
jgi:hypothetical protein